MKIAIMGTGGLGGYFGGRLALAGMDVTFIARGETLRTMRDQGLRVHSLRGDFAVQPVQVTDNPADAGPADLVLLAVKAYDLDQAMAAMTPLVGPETAILPVLNGVAHVARLQAAFGENRVLGGIATINARKTAPGVIDHIADLGQHQLEFGEWAGPISPRCERIQSLWEQAGVDGVAVANIVERMWWKLATFCGAGVFVAARGNRSQIWMPETRAMLHRTVDEVVRVARAQQIVLPDTLPDQMAEVFDNAPPTYQPSMLVDLENGNRLEVEHTNGFVSKLGKELGVDTPANDFIYACLKPHMNGRP